MNVPTRLTNVVNEILDAATSKNREALVTALNYSYGIMSIVGDDDTEQATARLRHDLTSDTTTENLVLEAGTQVDRIHRFLRNLPEDGQLWHGMYVTI